MEVTIMERRNKGNVNEGSKEKGIAMKVSRVSIGVNVILSLFKLLAGIAAHSGAMISDAVHSASDVFGTFIVMIGVTVADKKSDKEHPYGHERLECVASILLAVILMLIGWASESAEYRKSYTVTKKRWWFPEFWHLSQQCFLLS